AQESIPVLKDDTKETLHERIKTVERQLYVDTINKIITTNGQIERDQ
ncbi:MAG: phosphoribosylglycinamide formyltransferase, partial [Actinomycetota bacterium]|nr:phosphoribosylglycinamide formyltransferase [Actinomycetota bacterium]